MITPTKKRKSTYRSAEESFEDIYNYFYSNEIYGATPLELRSVDPKAFWLKKFLSKNKDALCLDYGCGAGNYTIFASSYVQKIVGVEISQEAIRLATKHNMAQNISYIHISPDPHQMPFKSNSFDIIFNYVMLEHVPNPQDIFKECFRLLKPGGALFLLTEHFSRFSFYYIEALISGSKNKELWPVDYRNNHLFRFKSKELFKMADETGFEIKSYVYSGHILRSFFKVFGNIVEQIEENSSFLRSLIRIYRRVKYRGKYELLKESNACNARKRKKIGFNRRLRYKLTIIENCMLSKIPSSEIYIWLKKT